MVKAVYDLQPTYEVDKHMGICRVWLTFRGTTYTGQAKLSDHDKEFFSEKVGLNIALSRARISILQDLKQQAKLIADTKYQMYQEALNYGTAAPSTVDPTGGFYKKVVKAQQNYKKVCDTFKREQKYLNKYLTEQDKMIEYVKLHRERVKTQ